jgi:cold shock CspA family protein
MIKRLIQKPAGYLYGFIAPDDESEDIYFGEESIGKNLLPNLVEGARVRAEIELSARGPRARLIFQDNDLPLNTDPHDEAPDQT